MSAWLTSLYDAAPPTVKRLFMSGYSVYLYPMREGDQSSALGDRVEALAAVRIVAEVVLTSSEPGRIPSGSRG